MNDRLLDHSPASTSPPSSPGTSTTRWIPVVGGELRVRRQRPSDSAAPTVLFVHGAFVNGHLWDRTMDERRLTSQHRTDRHLDLVALDLPLGAHHRPLAPGTDLSIPALTEMLVAVLDHLEVERAIVVGNDSGGAITQHALVTHPDRFSGALLTSTETPDNFPPRSFRFLFPPLRLRVFMWAAAQMLRTNVGRRLPFTFGHLVHRRLPAAEADRLMGPLWRSSGARRDLRRFLASATADVDLLRRVEARSADFPGPVDVAWSAGDRIFPDADADRIAGAYPAGRRVDDITGAGSLSPLDRPDQIAARVLALAERVAHAERAERGSSPGVASRP